MKLYQIPLIFCLFLLAGCLVTPVPETKKLTNTTQRLEVIGALSQGVELSLDDNKVDDAKKLNKNIQQLAETPTPQMVNYVMDSLKGDAQRAILDEEISKLIIEKRKIETETNAALASLRADNLSQAQKLRDAKAEADALKNPFKAIWYGISTLVKRFVYTIAGLTAVFFILRIFAGSSPIIGAIFGIFEQLIAMVLKAVAWVFPRVFRFAGNVPEKDFAAVKESRNRIIYTLEQLYLRYKNKAIPFETVFDELRSNMSETDKEEVRRALKELGFTRKG